MSSNYMPMSSTSDVETAAESDEAFAKRLQEEEFKQARQHAAPPDFQRTDEELARKMQEDEVSRRLEQVETAAAADRSRAASSSQPTQFLSSGQVATIRFKHARTGNLLNEVCYARSVGANIMMFEMATVGGMFLRVVNTTVVEFAYVSDDTARFIVNVLPNGAVTLLCLAHQYKQNMDGSIGWYLALNSVGRLIGNSSSNPNATWIFVAASSVPVVPDVNHSHAAVSSSNPLHAPAGSVAMSKVPDVFSSVESQVRWLGTAAGQEYLAKEPFLLQLFFDQKIHTFMHRPDWPEAALRSVQRPQSRNETGSPYSSSSMIIPGLNSVEDLSSFQENGFFILPGVVPSDMLTNAKRLVLSNLFSDQVVRRSTGSHRSSVGRSSLKAPLTSDPDLLSLFHDTLVAAAVERLLSGVLPRPKSAVEPVMSCHDITVQLPQLVDWKNPMYSDLEINDSGTRWKIDGFTQAGGHSPSTLTIVIALDSIRPLEVDLLGDSGLSATGNSGSEGQLVLFPGSHTLLQPLIRENILNAAFKNLSKFSDEDSLEKPKLSSSKQVFLNAGDAIIMTSKLAFREGHNLGSDVQSLVYFTVSHVDHERLKAAALDNWLVELGLFDRSPRSPQQAENIVSGAPIPRLPPPPGASISTLSYSGSSPPSVPPADTAQSIIDSIFDVSISSSGNEVPNVTHSNPGNSNNVANK